MSRSRGNLASVLGAALALAGLGCGKTTVWLGSRASPPGESAGAAGTAAAPGFGGMAAGGIAGATSDCAPSEETLRLCAPYASSPRRYDYHGCLNQAEVTMGGIGGAPAALCEGYAPCSYQHQGCLYYFTSGAAGADASGCAGVPGDAEWLAECGGEGFYGDDILGEAGEGGGGAGGEAGATDDSAGGAGSTAGAGGGGGCAGAPGDPAYDACAGGSGGAAGS